MTRKSTPALVQRVAIAMLAGVALSACLSPPATATEPHVFTHPGGVVGQAEIDVVRAKLAAGEEPWTSALGQLRGLAVAGRFDAAPTGEADQKEHARQAYANALVWATTGDEAAARRGIAILNVWGRTFAGYVPAEGQNLLIAGWIGALLGRFAEGQVLSVIRAGGVGLVGLESSAAPWIAATAASSDLRKTPSLKGMTGQRQARRVGARSAAQSSG
jgi:hypothetical protein